MLIWLMLTVKGRSATPRGSGGLSALNVELLMESLIALTVPLVAPYMSSNRTCHQGILEGYAKRCVLFPEACTRFGTGHTISGTESMEYVILSENGFDI